MRSDSRLACYVISSVLVPLTDDDLESAGSLTGSIAAKDPAASSLQVTKGPASKGPPKTVVILDKSSSSRYETAILTCLTHNFVEVI